MRVLVTGVSGFLSQALALELHKQGYEVIGTSRTKVSLPFKVHQIDFSTDNFELEVDAVFHVASLVSMWGNYDEFYSANVKGTENLIKSVKFKYLVYTSSPSVIANGKDLNNVNETIDYSTKYLANYPKTKALAEQLILKLNNENQFTMSLRPHLIFGKGDRNFIPKILDRANKNKLIQVGEGKNLVDLCYIKDCVEAHVLGLKALINNPNSRGQVYFISQGEPTNLFDWINQILVLNKLPKIKKKIGFKTAYFLAWVLEKIAYFTGKEPLLTRFLVEEMATNHYFDISKAKRDLGYQPKYSIKQALAEMFNQHD